MKEERNKSMKIMLEMKENIEELGQNKTNKQETGQLGRL